MQGGRGSASDRASRAGDPLEGLVEIELISAVASIVLIDLVLSGDNAIVIGMAAARLPPRQRRLAILFGGGAAIVLRISLTAVAALLLTVPGLQAIGGVVLVWIAFKLLKEEDTSDGVREAASLRGAVVTILVADFVMSLDNILGVAGAAGGDVRLLLFGLVLSVGILMLGGSLVAEFINRLVWLVYVGAAVIAWVGTDMLLEDPWVGNAHQLPDEHQTVATALVTVAVLVVAHFTHRRQIGHRNV